MEPFPLVGILNPVAFFQESFQRNRSVATVTGELFPILQRHGFFVAQVPRLHFKSLENLRVRADLTHYVFRPEHHPKLTDLTRELQTRPGFRISPREHHFVAGDLCGLHQAWPRTPRELYVLVASDSLP